MNYKHNNSRKTSIFFYNLQMARTLVLKQQCTLSVVLRMLAFREHSALMHLKKKYGCCTRIIMLIKWNKI
jgi:hypothetical protein